MKAEVIDDCDKCMQGVDRKDQKLHYYPSPQKNFEMD
jgi:23S rRNA maturation-related 3'-5' exoribonuclease YhaM